MDILGLFDSLFSSFGVNKKMGSYENENEPIENNKSAYKQASYKKEAYKRKLELDESRIETNKEAEFSKELNR